MLARLDENGLDQGPRHKAGAERFCAVAGTTAPVTAMIRFVLGPDGSVVPDLRRRLPGRGIWITGTRQALRAAVARKIFARSFKREVRVPPDLIDCVERLMEQAALDALSIAHKAAKVITGAARVEAAIAREPLLAILHAREAAADAARHLREAFRRRWPGRDVAVVEAFASSRLDLALGRPNVVHAALLAGPESETFLARAARLDRFRTEAKQERGVMSKRVRSAKNW
ncbi:MAG TPA: RNA-binding protein [Xanthobacteraceae bacterium]